MKLWIVMVEDRHLDSAPYPFTDRTRAISEARRIAEEMAVRPGDLVELTPRLEVFPYFANVGHEGDCVWVVERDLDQVIP